MLRPSELCCDCGLCCDGTLFSSLSLDAVGLSAARDHRLPVLQTHSGANLALPCAALQGVLCRIYEGRPQCCAEYECELLLRVTDHRQSFEQARKTIEATREIHRRVTAAVGRTRWWSAYRSALDAERTDSEWARDNADLLSDLKQLDKLIRRYFWG